MGRSFNNIHVRFQSKPTVADVNQIADMMTEGLAVSMIDNQEEADIKVSVIVCTGHQWVTVLADSIDDDLDAQLEKTKRLSETLKTQALAIACFDSDYLCLNMVDIHKQVDVWAACGRFPYGKVPRRSNIAAWSSYVKDANHFRQEMKRSYACAEDCLDGIADDLGIPSVQASCLDESVPPDSERLDFYYRIDGDREKAPPCFKLNTASSYYSFNDLNHVSFVNQGSASKGVMVCLTGPCITEHQVTVEKIEIRYGYDPRSYEIQEIWKICPVELKEITFRNGVTGLAGECPELRIPAGVREDLPWKKKMDLEFQRGFNVHFKLCPCNRNVETYGPLQVTLIPLKNLSGQHSYVMDHQSVWEKKQAKER